MEVERRVLWEVSPQIVSQGVSGMEAKVKDDSKGVSLQGVNPSESESGSALPRSEPKRVPGLSLQGVSLQGVNSSGSEPKGVPVVSLQGVNPSGSEPKGVPVVSLQRE